jgi:hypothetical protein
VVRRGEFSCMTRHYQMFFPQVVSSEISKPLAFFKLFCGGDADRSVIPVKTTPELPSILTSEGMVSEYEKKLFTIFNIVILVDSIGSCECDRFLFFSSHGQMNPKNSTTLLGTAKNGQFFLLGIKMCAYKLFWESRTRRTFHPFKTFERPICEKIH